MCLCFQLVSFEFATPKINAKHKTFNNNFSPCWYCSGLIRQFNIGKLLVGDDINFKGGHDWVQEHGCDVTVMNDLGLIKVMGDFIIANPKLWNEDIGED